MVLERNADQAVDFYVKRGVNAQYLGTIFVKDGTPDGIQALARFYPPETDDLFNTASFQAAVEQLLEMHGGTDEWPHKYPRSTETPFTYIFDAGSVYGYEEGYQFWTLMCNGARAQAPFPNMLRISKRDG